MGVWVCAVVVVLVVAVVSSVSVDCVEYNSNCVGINISEDSSSPPSSVLFRFKGASHNKGRVGEAGKNGGISDGYERWAVQHHSIILGAKFAQECAKPLGVQ